MGSSLVSAYRLRTRRPDCILMHYRHYLPLVLRLCYHTHRTRPGFYSYYYFRLASEPRLWGCPVG